MYVSSIVVGFFSGLRIVVLWDDRPLLRDSCHPILICGLVLNSFWLSVCLCFGWTCLDVQPAGPRSSAAAVTSASWSGRFSRSGSEAQQKSRLCWRLHAGKTGCAAYPSMHCFSRGRLTGQQQMLSIQRNTPTCRLLRVHLNLNVCIHANGKALLLWQVISHCADL